MKKNCQVILLAFIVVIISCKKDKVFNTVTNAPQKVTSPEYIDSLLLVNQNNYQIKTTDPLATFFSADSNINMTSSGLITRLTSAEVVPIVITWTNKKLPKTTIYGFGATDIDQDLPFKSFQAAKATDAYAAYLQGWKMLQKLPNSGATYAIILRHADASYGEDWTVRHTTPAPANWWKSPDSALARQLNPQGIQRAAILGQVFKDLNYPIKRIITSEFFRARQTADLMNIGPAPIIDSRINHGSHSGYATGLFNAMVAVLAEQPIDNQMTLIVAHHPMNETPAATGYPSFPTVSPFNWTGAYFVNIAPNGTITYAGAASWAMFKYWRDLKLKKL